MTTSTFGNKSGRLALSLGIAFSLCAAGGIAVMPQTAQAAVIGSSTIQEAAAASTGTTMTTMAAGKYVNAKAAYTQLNKFRTTKKVWYWNADNKTKTKLNTKASNTLKKLKRSKTLEAAAKKRAKDISKLFDHVRPNGSSCFTVYPEGFFTMGENIAAGPTSGKAVTEMWKETKQKYANQGHRRNMLDANFTHVGIACYKVKGVCYWVQAFGGVGE